MNLHRFTPLSKWLQACNSLIVVFALLASSLHSQNPPSLAWWFEPASGLPNKLHWQTEPGQRYDLWESSDLKEWTQVGGYPKEAGGPTMEHAFAPSTKGFFRIGWPETPAGPENEFVLIPGGSFQMGDPFGEGWSEERPAHTVHVSAFYIGHYQVAWGLWDEVRTWALSNGYDFNPGSGKAADHPVHSIRWHDVVKWCNARSEREGFTPAYQVDGNVFRTGTSNSVECDWGSSGYRLPSEAEWEKAARGGLSGRRYPWGDTISHNQANYRASISFAYLGDQSTGGYHPGGSEPVPFTSAAGNFAPNGYGLHDVAGNVWEWCWDWYSESYYGTSPETDPRGPASGSARVGRGGSWNNSAGDCRVVSRGRYAPSYWFITLGFRLTRSSVPSN